MNRNLLGPKKCGYTLLSETNHVDNQMTEDTAQAQNVKASRVYVFGKMDVTEDELHNGAIELPELRSRKHVHPFQNDVEANSKNTVIERPISEGDTLQSIALKYGCQVAELKRVNNLIKDQEFFALKDIKVPAKRHGLLTELVDAENRAAGPNGPKISLGATASNDTVLQVIEPSDTDNWDESDPEERTELLVRTVSIRGVLANQSKEAENFLQKMDSDIKKIVTSTRTRKESLEDVTSTLTRKSIQPLQKPKSMLSDVDCGMSWWGVVAVIFVIGLLTPLLYFLYVYHEEEHPSSTVANGVVSDRDPLPTVMIPPQRNS